MAAGKRKHPKARVPLRLAWDIYMWMERVRRLRGWNRTEFIELALREMRRHGVPQSLDVEETHEQDVPA